MVGKRKRGVTGQPAKAPAKRGSGSGRNPKVAGKSNDWEYSSDEDVSLPDSDNDLNISKNGQVDHNSSDDDDYEAKYQHESVAEKRLRLAQQYLSKLKQTEKLVGDEAESEGSDEEDDRGIVDSRPNKKLHDKVSEALLKESLAARGDLIQEVAQYFEKIRFEFSPTASKLKLVGVESEVEIYNIELSRKPMTCCVSDAAGDFVYLGSKDCNIYKVNLAQAVDGLPEFERDIELPDENTSIPSSVHDSEEDLDEDSVPGGVIVFKGLTMSKQNRKTKYFPGHRNQVLCLDISPDGGTLASGGIGKEILLWDTAENKLKHTFRRHRDNIMGLCFQKESPFKGNRAENLFEKANNELKLFSVSKDRAIGVWDVGARCSIDEQYGHQSEVTAVDCLFKPRIVTASQDLSVRFWKIPEESQLVFSTHHTGSIDCVKFINEQLFVSGSEDGFIKLWHVAKKKPTFSLEAHDGKWITALARLLNSDIFASAAKGEIKIWKVDPRSKTIKECVAKIILRDNEIVSGMCFTSVENIEKDKKILIKLFASVGGEHRLGRWNADPSIPGSLRVFKFTLNSK